MLIHKIREHKNNNLIFILLIILSMVFWGLSWVSAKVMAVKTPAVTLVFWRMVITFLSFIPLVIAFRTKLKLNKTTLFWVAVSAVLLCLYYALFFLGLISALPGASGVLLTTTSPLFTAIMMALIKRRRPSAKDIAGLVLGIAGGLLLLRVWQWQAADLLKSGNLIILGASIVWSLFTICGQRSQRELNVFSYSFYLYGIALIISFFPAVMGGAFNISDIPGVVWLNLLYIALFSTTFANTIYLFGSKKIGSHKASAFMFLVPVNAVVFSWIILGEIPTWSTIAGGIIAMAAVAIIQYKENEGQNEPKGT